MGKQGGDTLLVTKFHAKEQKEQRRKEVASACADAKALDACATAFASAHAVASAFITLRRTPWTNALCVFAPYAPLRETKNGIHECI